LDFATIIGLVLAFGAVVASAFIGDLDFKTLWQPSAIILVVGGTFGATLISFPLKTFLSGFLNGFRTAFREPVFHERETIAAALEDDFMRKGIQLVIDGRDTDIIRKILETEVGFVQERGVKSEMVFGTLGGYSPTLGIIGTVLGLIGMLRALGGPATGAGGSSITGTLGNSTAEAFVATFFGILLANLLWLPISSKIKERNAQLMMLREIMIEGILSIQAGDNPRLLEEKLHAFLDPNDRASDVEEGGAVGEPSYQN